MFSITYTFYIYHFLFNSKRIIFISYDIKKFHRSSTFADTSAILDISAIIAEISAIEDINLMANTSVSTALITVVTAVITAVITKVPCASQDALVISAVIT